MTRSDFMSDSARYEVVLVRSEMSLTASEWTWRRFDGDSNISARGLRHETLPACFAEVREHARRFGAAPVAVNLTGDEGPPAAQGAQPPRHQDVMPNRLAPKAMLRRRSALRG